MSDEGQTFTVRQFIDMLLTNYTESAQIIICDADTSWTGALIHHRLDEKGRVELSIEYHEMDSER